MRSKRYIIQICNQNKLIGYLKSSSYTNRSYKTTLNKSEAKTFTNLDKVQGEIDFLMSVDVKPINYFMYVEI